VWRGRDPPAGGTHLREGPTCGRDPPGGGRGGENDQTAGGTRPGAGCRGGAPPMRRRQRSGAGAELHPTPSPSKTIVHKLFPMTNPLPTLWKLLFTNSFHFTRKYILVTTVCKLFRNFCSTTVWKQLFNNSFLPMTNCSPSPQKNSFKTLFSSGPRTWPPSPWRACYPTYSLYRPQTS